MNNKYILSRCKCIVFVLVLSMANVVFAESVTVHVPEGDVTLDEALRKGYAGAGVDYDALISADDLVVTGPVRGDHVPEMEGDRMLVEDAIPGYFNMGRLFANGYLKALLKGTGN